VSVLGEVVADLSDPVGWVRLGVIHDVRDAHRAGLVRWVDGRVIVHRDVPTELRDRMRAHRDVVAYALGFPTTGGGES
jgi:hypothetical protein